MTAAPCLKDIFFSRLSRLPLHLFFHLPFFSQIANPSLNLLCVGLSVSQTAAHLWGDVPQHLQGLKKMTWKLRKYPRSSSSSRVRGQNVQRELLHLLCSFFKLSLFCFNFSHLGHAGAILFFWGCASAPLGEIDLFSCGNSGIQWSSLCGSQTWHALWEMKFVVNAA